MNLDTIIAERPSKKIYRDGNYVIKVFDENFSKADVLNEALNQARVEETGLNIPKVEEVAKVDEKWAIVSTFIEGKTLEQIISEDRNNLEKYIDRFVEIQLEMHSKTSPLLNKLKDKTQREISSTDLNATTRYELHTRLESMPKHVKVCHGDFVPSNIIIAPEGKAYILDWSHATQGNASADAARTYLLFNLSNDLEAAEMYIDKFCAKSDTAKQYVQQWLPIVAASRYLRGKSEEKKLLMRWLDVFDYQ